MEIHNRAPEDLCRGRRYSVLREAVINRLQRLFPHLTRCDIEEQINVMEEDYAKLIEARHGVKLAP